MFILTLDDVVIGTPEYIAESSRTQDISFFDLAENYDIQCKAHLASSVFIKPENPFSTGCTGHKLHDRVACYLSAFKGTTEKQTETHQFLITNPTLRILWVKEQEHEHQ